MQKYLVGLSVILSAVAQAQSVTKIDSFTPIGEVGTVSQVHAHFSNPMFALGSQNQAAPFQSNCDSLGTGRWLNPKEWVFDFSKALPPKTACRFTLKPGQKSIKGVPVMNAEPYQFVVAQAEIVSTIPDGNRNEADFRRENAYYTWVSPDQIFVLRFNHPITAKDLEDRISLHFEGRKEPVGVKLLGPEVLAKLRKEGRVGLYDPKEPAYAVEPKIKLPENEMTVVSLHDKLSNQAFFYRVQKAFHADFTCTRENAGAPCSPLLRAELGFNSPVSVEDLRKIKAVPVGKKNASAIQATVNDSPSRKSSHETEVFFNQPLRPGTTYRIELPSSLKDIQGRSLSNQKSFPLEFKTDALPAIAKFSTGFGVIEAAHPLVPLSIRNLGKSLEVKSSDVMDFKTSENAADILHWLSRVEHQQIRKTSYSEAKDFEGDRKAADYESVFSAFSKEIQKQDVKHAVLPALGDKNEAEVIGIPIAQKGLHIVEVQSRVLGKKILDRETPLFTSTAVLVTNLGVHFKWGQGGPSLVWVTELSSGKPVAGAQISVQSCTGAVIGKGVTESDGTYTFAKLPNAQKISDQYKCGYTQYQGTQIVVTAKKDDDFSFALDSWKQGIENWRFNLGYGGSQNLATHTVFARDLLKPGQKVQMKHYFREFQWQGFTVPKKKPAFLAIRHNGTEETWSFPIKFDGQGIATSEWSIPESANLGSYSVYLTYQSGKKYASDWISAGNFEVQEFRLPALNVSVKAPDPITQETKSPQVNLQGTYISGGAASELPVEVRFLRKEVQSHSRVLASYLYSQDKLVVTGIHDQKSDDDSEMNDGEGEAAENSSVTQASKKEETLESSKLVQKVNLDQGGSARVDFPKEVLKADQDAEVMVGINYPDPNGEIQSVLRSISIFSRDRYLGLHTDTTSYAEDPKNIKMKFKLAALNGSGVGGEKIEVSLYQSIDYVHRIRLVGGFYGYHTTVEVKKLGSFCEGKTEESGAFVCLGNAPGPGTYILEAKSRDSQGRNLTLVQNLQIYGQGGDSASYSENDRLTLVPSKQEYDAGETIKVAVLSSFKEFQALVTLERDGVMEHFVQNLSGDKPEISLPVKMQYSPNFVLSVFAVRGRLNDPAPTGLLDLSKPAFKLGMIPVRVGTKSHELPITVKTDKVVYQIRNKSHVTIETKPGAEVALAVIDQALLKLKPNLSFDLLNAMMISQGHQVETSTLQMNIIGKRHYGKKANPFGGGGGKLMTRELLDSLIAWMPRLKADSQGKIETDFKLNDSISSFTVVAIGTEGTNFYGTAKTEISATQDLQILSSIPPTLREKDQLPLQFILRNTTLNPLHVKANLSWAATTEKEQMVEVPAQSSREVKWAVQIPVSVVSIPIHVAAVSTEGPADALSVTSKVVEVLPSRVIEGYLDQLEGPTHSTSVKFPENAALNKGGYRIQVQSQLSQIPETLNQYLKNYSYNCIEQQTSKAIGLQDPKLFQKMLKGLKTYLDSNSLLKYFPDMRYGSVDLTAYFLTITSEASKVNPAFRLPDNELTQRLIEAVRKGMRGQIFVSEPWWPSYTKTNERIAAGEALAHYEPIAVADYEQLKASRTKGNLNHLLALIRILDLSPKSLSNSLADRELFWNEAIAQYHVENSRMRLSNARFYFYGSLSESPDALKARTLLAMIEKDQKDNATKLLRALMEEMKTGYFDTTPGDAWSVISLKSFQKKYEKVSARGEFTAEVGNVKDRVSLTDQRPVGTTYLPVAKLNNPSLKSELKTTFKGQGKPWAFTFVEAALPITQPIQHGFKIEKQVILLQGDKAGGAKRGDIYEVQLKIENSAPETWGALADPIPTGASILSTENRGPATVAFEERRMDRMQVFFEYLPQGTSEFRYKLRLNQAGSFELPPTRLEAMYDPTQYGEFPNASIKVNP